MIWGWGRRKSKKKISRGKRGARNVADSPSPFNGIALVLSVLVITGAGNKRRRSTPFTDRKGYCVT